MSSNPLAIRRKPKLCQKIPVAVLLPIVIDAVK
jgi:hypothetical protein